MSQVLGEPGGYAGLWEEDPRAGVRDLVLGSLTGRGLGALSDQ